jgi:UDP-glucose 4-epimerase
MTELKNQIVVTGGAGYIGSHTVVELIEAGFEPIIVDDFRNSKPWILDRIEEICGVRSKHYAMDCCDEEKLRAVFQENENIVGVIHFAAYKAVGESVDHPVMYYQNNIGSLCAVLNVMKTEGINNLVFSSSCTVYGEPSNPIVTEDTPIQAAASPYGATKIACEQIIEFTANAQKKLQGTLLRYFNPIGAHESAKIGELPQGIPNNLVPYITQTANGVRDQITVFGDDYNTHDGTCLRDYIHVVDLAKAHVKAIKWAMNQESGFVEAFNLGTGNASSVLEIIHTFEKVNDLKLNYKVGPRREGDVEQIYANPSKAEKELNWRCDYSLSDALKHSWNWEKSIQNS